MYILLVFAADMYLFRIHEVEAKVLPDSKHAGVEHI